MNFDQGDRQNTTSEALAGLSRKTHRLSVCVFLVGVHSLTLGSFIFFFTDAFYNFFFGVDVDNPFLVKQAGLFLFCLSLFYLVPLTDLPHKHRMVDLIIVTKVLAVLFLVNSAWLVPRPGPIFLAAAGDALMATLLIFFSLAAGLLLKKEQRPRKGTIPDPN